VYWIEEIAKERTAGAHDVALRCAVHLTALCRTASGGRDVDLLEKLTDVGIRLVRTKPAMAPIVNLVNGLLLRVQPVALQGGADAEAVRKEAIHFLEAFQKSSRSALDRIGDRVVRLLEPGCTVLTLSASNTVARALEEAYHRGIVPEVVVAESRPLMEGKLLARRLGARGLRVTLVVDAAVGLFAERCDVLMVGADAVGSEALVNKVGTWCAVKATKAAGKPRYALAEESKLVPRGWGLSPSEGDPSEVLSERWANVIARNPYFEQVSLQSFSGVVTETGVYMGSSLARKIASLRLSPILSSALYGKVP
jgi:translation initiation factor 2B subunit (eIF-2B alpha/beta/delta family)